MPFAFSAKTVSKKLQFNRRASSMEGAVETSWRRRFNTTFRQRRGVVVFVWDRIVRLLSLQARNRLLFGRKIALLGQCFLVVRGDFRRDAFGRFQCAGHARRISVV